MSTAGTEGSVLCQLPVYVPPWPIWIGPLKVTPESHCWARSEQLPIRTKPRMLPKSRACRLFRHSADTPGRMPTGTAAQQTRSKGINSAERLLMWLPDDLSWNSLVRLGVQRQLARRRVWVGGPRYQP